jgi:hypothetical protein
MTRWVTPPRPPSDRNGGRFEIGIPGRLHQNPQAGTAGPTVPIVANEAGSILPIPEDNQ